MCLEKPPRTHVPKIGDRDIDKTNFLLKKLLNKEKKKSNLPKKPVIHPILVTTINRVQLV